MKVCLFISNEEKACYHHYQSNFEKLIIAFCYFQISMNAHSLTEAVPTRATTPRDHLLVPVQMVWSWILEKEVAKVKLIFTICAHASMSTDRGELYFYLVRYQIRCCTQWSCRKYVKYDRSDLSTTIPFLKSSSE